METVKLIGVKMPAKLASALGHIAKEQGKTISSLIREMATEYIEDDLSISSWKLVEKGRQEYRDGICTSWRKTIYD